MSHAERLLLQEPVSPTTKGLPVSATGLSLGDIASQGWNVLAGDVSFPVAVMRQSAVEMNLNAMSDYAVANNVLLAPHGKTTMAPQIFYRQLDKGAWGITVATTTQLAVCVRFGIDRILLANQLIGHENVHLVAEAINEHADLEVYCLIDSLALVDYLVAELHGCDLARPLKTLVEIGSEGGRCGVRTVEEGLDVARELARHPKIFSLCGIEAFEGAVTVRGSETVPAAIDRLLGNVRYLAERCDADGLFAEDEVILTAGGSLYFHLVVAGFRGFSMGRRHRTLLRSGCYVTHDDGMYQANADSVAKEGSGFPALQSALEVWGAVQSVPESGLFIVGLGKRDISHDISLPVILRYFDGKMLRVVERGVFEVMSLNDHHAIVRCEAGYELQVGDLCGFGISHPCTTFDKWPVIFMVDDDYTVREGVRTFF